MNIREEQQCKISNVQCGTNKRVARFDFGFFMAFFTCHFKFLEGIASPELTMDRLIISGYWEKEKKPSIEGLFM
jgi:hypothetical protein